MQKILKHRQRRSTRGKVHDWAFGGLITCGHCGCALTAEKKKEKYVYYHCTGARGKCPEPFVREEEIARQFGEAIARLRMDDDVLSWVTHALRESHEKKREFHEQALARLRGEYSRIQSRIDAMYVDKLDGLVAQEFFDQKNAVWRKDQSDLRAEMARYEKADENYVSEGCKLLELSQRAAQLYSLQNMSEKRELIDFVFSNSTWMNGRLTPVYRKPFDLLAVTNEKQRELRLVEGGKSINSDIWLGN